MRPPKRTTCELFEESGVEANALELARCASGPVFHFLLTKSFPDAAERYFRHLFDVGGWGSEGSHG